MGPPPGVVSSSKKGGHIFKFHNFHSFEKSKLLNLHNLHFFLPNDSFVKSFIFPVFFAYFAFAAILHTQIAPPPDIWKLHTSTFLDQFYSSRMIKMNMSTKVCPPDPHPPGLV